MYSLNEFMRFIKIRELDDSYRGYLRHRISNFENLPVHIILLSTFGNIPFDPKFQYVNVKTPNNIINFLQSITEKLSEEKIQEIIEYLVMYVPN